MRKTTKNTKKTKIMRTISLASALMIAFALAGCGNISGNETDTTTESNSATSNSEVADGGEETVCWIMETEKEKAKALQEYTSNALLELASAETEEETEEGTDIDGGIDGEETEEVSYGEAASRGEEEDAIVSDTSSSSNKSSSSGSSGSSSSSGSSNNSSTSSGSSGSSGSSSSSSKSSSHKHSYTSKVTKQATCTSTGTITYTCSCGDSYTEEIAKTDHTWVEYTYTEEVYHPAVWEDYDLICTTCNYRTNSGADMDAHLAETGHFGTANGTVLISEAYTETVTKTGYKCSVCGATK